eukprot:s73_g8.t1
MRQDPRKPSFLQVISPILMYFLHSLIQIGFVEIKTNTAFRFTEAVAVGIYAFQLYDAASSVGGELFDPMARMIRVPMFLMPLIFIDMKLAIPVYASGSLVLTFSKHSALGAQCAHVSSASTSSLLVLADLHFETGVLAGLVCFIHVVQQQIEFKVYADDASSLLAACRKVLKGACDGDLVLDSRNCKIVDDASALEHMLKADKRLTGTNFLDLLLDTESRERFLHFLQSQAVTGKGTGSIPPGLRISLQGAEGPVSLDIFCTSCMVQGNYYFLLALKADPDQFLAPPDANVPAPHSSQTTQSSTEVVEPFEELMQVAMLVNNDTPEMDIEEVTLSFLRSTDDKGGMPTFRSLDWPRVESIVTACCASSIEPPEVLKLSAPLLLRLPGARSRSYYCAGDVTVGVADEEDLVDPGLAASLDQLQPGDCPLPAEECERFIQVLPAPEHLLPLANFQEAPSKLRDIEREILPLAKLTRLRERLRLLWLFKTLDKRMADAMRQMCTLQSACSQVRKSAVLRSLLEIIEVLFNYVNYGHTVASNGTAAPHGAAARRKVDVQSLTHLVETKSDPERAPFPKFNMLHFCIKDLLKQRPDFTFAQLEEELKDLSAASFVNLAHQSLALDRLKEDLEFVKTELHGHREEYQKKEESPKQVETPKGAIVKFDLEENDTASEEEIQREGSDESVSRNLERSPKRSHLGQLVSSAIDTFSFAEDWWHGSAIIGINEKGGLDAVLAADGAAPPPGMMYRWRPSGRCKPYLCEVRGALLVLYRVKKIGHSASLRGTFYIVLPGAEIALLESLYASDFARQLARDKSCSGLELRPADGSRAEYFLTKTPKEAERWCDFLQTRTQQWDGGFVSHYVGWGFLSSCWRRLFCVLDRPNRLLAFSRVRDYAEGLKPEHIWELSAACSIVAFDAEKSSSTAKGLLSVAPVGFELVTADNQMLQFSVDSVQHLHCWLEELQSSVAPSRSSRPSVSGVTCGVGANGEELFDLFADPSPSGTGGDRLSFSVVDGSGSPSQLRRKLMLSVGVPDVLEQDGAQRSVERADSDEEIHQGLLATSSFCALADAAGAVEEVAVPDALSQLRQLEVEMEGVVEKWTRTFAATEADCRALLRFFGLAKGALHSAAQELLQALSTFQQQLRVAWAEVEQHQTKTPRGPGPAVARNRPNRSASAAAASTALPPTVEAADAAVPSESEATQSSEEQGTFVSVCSNES